MRKLDQFRGPCVKHECVGLPAQPNILVPPLKLRTLFELWTKMVLHRRHFKKLFVPLLQESDDFLDDIGYRKEEVLWALRLPMKIDASKALEACRKERLHSARLVLALRRRD